MGGLSFGLGFATACFTPAWVRLPPAAAAGVANKREGPWVGDVGCGLFDFKEIWAAYFLVAGRFPWKF